MTFWILLTAFESCPGASASKITLNVAYRKIAQLPNSVSKHNSQLTPFHNNKYYFLYFSSWTRITIESFESYPGASASKAVLNVTYG